jgi:hypothetical protein
MDRLTTLEAHARTLADIVHSWAADESDRFTKQQLAFTVQGLVDELLAVLRDRPGPRTPD